MVAFTGLEGFMEYRCRNDAGTGVALYEYTKSGITVMTWLLGDETGSFLHDLRGFDY